MDRRPSTSTHTAVDLSPSVSTTSGVRRRSFASTSDISPDSNDVSTSIEGPPSKARKVSRACDFCKSRKAKCSGNQPCSKCVSKGRTCLYNAKYTRGRPPTPPPSVISHSIAPNVHIENEIVPNLSTKAAELRDEDSTDRAQCQSAAPFRASPELGMAEIQGQVFDPTSGLTFLHRAWKRLSAQSAHTMPDVVKTSVENQPMAMAGDRPLPETDERMHLSLPSPEETRALLALYFDVCIATYRFLHRPSVEKWLGVVERNLQDGRPVWEDIGHARAAIVLIALAIATAHQEKSKCFSSPEDDARSISKSDVLFGVSSRLTDLETGYPKIESAQARLVQVLYLLTTSRFNKSWYVFGNALQIISTLGLHRRENSKRRRTSKTDYIQVQCRLRTFWTAYTLDNYLGVVFGRPRHFHDEDIDQDFPDRLNDEDMTSSGPSDLPESSDQCHIDALILHAKIAHIIGCISREVYTIKDISESERVTAAHRLIQRIHEWYASLPLHLGSIPPSMLIPSYRRQATVLKLAHSHAIMHAGRLFLLGLGSSTSVSSHVEVTINAARTVLETVDHMAREGPIFHAFWWTHYVTFCALVVVYVWEIQQKRLNIPVAVQQGGKNGRTRLLDLAERCQTHLARATATNSPSRRYAVILEEFRAAATSQPAARQDGETSQPRSSGVVQDAMSNQQALPPMYQYGQTMPIAGPEQPVMLDPHVLDEWQTTDWLDLDSSAFWPQVDFDESMVWPGMG